jgi:hypothetical protein
MYIASGIGGDPVKNIKRKYIKMLELEFYDLKEDIDALIENEKSKMEKGIISNYVFMENLSTLRNEILSIREFIDEIDKLDTERYDTINNMLDDIKQIFVKRFRENGFTRKSNELLLRKIEKVNLYFKDE